MAGLHPSSYHSCMSIKSWSIPKIFLLLFTILITIIILICSLNMFMSFSLGPKAPIIQINSLSIPYFTITNSNVLAGIWIANLTVSNPNLALDLYMNHIEAALFYRQDNALSVTSMDDFDLGFEEQRAMYVKFATTGKEDDHQPIIEYPLLKEIEENVRRGRVRFSMRMNIMVMYKSGSWSRQALLHLHCLDLDLGFVAGTADLIGSGPKDCPVVFMISD